MSAEFISGCFREIDEKALKLADKEDDDEDEEKVRTINATSANENNGKKGDEKIKETFIANKAKKPMILRSDKKPANSINIIIEDGVHKEIWDCPPTGGLLRVRFISNLEASYFFSNITTLSYRFEIVCDGKNESMSPRKTPATAAASETTASTSLKEEKK